MTKIKAAAKRKAANPRKLSMETLVPLGASRLAKLVLAQAEHDPVFARSARLALAAKHDPSVLTHEIDKRLNVIRRSRSFIEWDKVKPLAQELDQLRQIISDSLAEQSPRLAAEQMGRLLGVATSIFERSDDSSGALGAVFREGGEDLGRLWTLAGDMDPERLAADILSLIENDGYGVFDELPGAASPALGPDGRSLLRRLVLERMASTPPERRERYAYKVKWLLPKLADLDNDVDAYIATVPVDRSNAILNAQVAERLIAHDRAAEALEWIDAPTERGYNERELADLRLQALEQLGRKEEVQTQRRYIFERWLDRACLRAWLKGLPDFEDFDAEQASLDLAAQHVDAMLALSFLIQWPDEQRADQLIRDRLDDLEARRYEVLRSAAEQLSANHAGAATLLYRHLAEGVLNRAASKYYPYAVRDYHSAAALAKPIREDATILSHEEWIEHLHKRHGRKVGFWSIVQGRRENTA